MKHILVLTGLLLFGSSMVFGQKLITLAEAVETGLERNPEINQLISRIQQKTMERKANPGLADPVAAYAREGMSSTGTSPFNEQRLEIRQDFDFPLQTVRVNKAVNYEQQALEQQLRSTESLVQTNIKKFYIDVLYARYLEQLRKEELELARELVVAVRLRKEGGVGTEMDCLSAELNMAEAANQINDADRYLHQARYTLFNYMGLLPEEQSYGIEFQDTLSTHEELIHQDDVLAALPYHPENLSQEIAQSAQNMRIKAARADLLPDMSLGYLRQDFGTGYDFNGFTAGMSLPLWGAWKQKGRIEIEKLRMEEMKWDRTATSLDLKKRVEMAWHSYENSKVILERYQTDMKSKSGILLELSMEAYRLGQIDLLKLIEAQRLYLRGQKTYLDAVHDYYLRLAELEYFFDGELVY